MLKLTTTFVLPSYLPTDLDSSVANTRRQSIPGTRYFFTQIMTGYLTADDLEDREKEEENKAKASGTKLRVNKYALDMPEVP